LQHLRWLVIDEADRLLDQAFQDWLPLVLQSTQASGEGVQDAISSTELPFTHEAVSWRPNAVPVSSIMGLGCWATPLRKLLFSATLTRNPAKLAQLHLHRPTFLTVTLDEERYAVPADLEESLVVLEEEGSSKVSVLLYLLHAFRLTRTLCFTKSVVATEKLATLLTQSTSQHRIAAFSGDLLAARRAQLLEQFNDGEIDVLICSDGAARGLDLRNVHAVINYDIPVHAKTYIHRVGRTARAGQKGLAYSILEAREAYHFKQMLAKGRLAEKPVKKLRITPRDLEPHQQAVDTAIEALQQQ
jgi:ATP-dependent RNA helicase DDX51/DBP6